MANEPSLPSAARPHGRMWRVFLPAAASLSLLVAAAGGVAYGSYVLAQRSIGHFDLIDQPAAGGSGPQRHYGPCVEDVCNYLLLGSDSRAGLSPQEQEEFGTNEDIGGSNRADTIMLVHTEPRRQKAIILSFPRDLWVPIPDSGEGKINSAFEGGLNGGGPQVVTRTVEQLTGLRINHVLYVDLAGFEGVVEALGGVDMCVPYAMSDPLTGLDIQAGCQRFDGRTALAYVRTRHQPCDAIPDFARIGRQQQFLSAVLNRLLSPGELVQAPKLIRPVARNLVTDPGFKLADIIYLVSQLNGINTGAADFRVVPGAPTTIYPPSYPGGISIVRMDPSAEALFRAIREGRPLGELGKALPDTEISPANITVAVVDRVSGGTALDVLTKLGEGGFDTSPGLSADASALSGLIEGSAIVYKRGQEGMAGVVQKYLYPTLELVRAPKGVLTSPVAVVVAAGYTPSEPPPDAQPTCP